MRESPSDPHWLMEARPQGNVVKIAILSFLLFSSSSYSPGLVCLIVEAPHQENVEDWSIFLPPQITTFLALISVFTTQC